MTTQEVMNLDCRREENRKIIQKVLRQIKPLSKYSDEKDIPFEAIEKAITVMCKKYTMRINSFAPDVWASNEYVIWKAWLINDTNMKTIDDVFGITLYEVFAKTAIRLYAEVKRGISTRKA